MLTGGLLPWLACPFKKQAVITIKPVITPILKGTAGARQGLRLHVLSSNILYDSFLGGSPRPNVLHSWLHMSEAAKQAAVHFLGPLFEPWTRGPQTIVPPLVKEVLHFQSTSATLMFQGKRTPQMIQPHIQSTRSHAHPDTDTMLIHTHAHSAPSFGRSSSTQQHSRISRFTVTGQKVRGAVLTMMQVHHSAPGSCSTWTSTPSLN